LQHVAAWQVDCNKGEPTFGQNKEEVSMSVPRKERRQALRTQIGRLQGLRIVAACVEGVRILPAKLVDLSAGGFGIEMFVPLPAGSSVFMACEYSCDDMFLDVRGRSTIAYCRGRGDGVFQLGVTFQDVMCRALYSARERFGKYRGGLERAVA
jgi:hypothetical protein